MPVLRVDSGTANKKDRPAGTRDLIDSSAFDLLAAGYAVPDDQTRCQDHANQSIRRKFRI
jgi:hypothetical protein